MGRRVRPVVGRGVRGKVVDEHRLKAREVGAINSVGGGRRGEE
jgi:hypothetical protein